MRLALASALAAVTALLLAAPAGAQMAALPPDVQAAIRTIGPTMGADGVGRTGDALRPVMPATLEATLRDARYGPDPRNRLDVFSLGNVVSAVPGSIASPVPGNIASPVPGGGGRPVLVFVHGGGFTGGDKTRPGVFYYDNIGAWAARAGMVGVIMTYRLAPAHGYPAVVEDIAAALAWVRANIAGQGGDPARIVLVGQSAGAAHVADYLALHAQAPGVAAAALISGVYDPSRFPPGPPEQAYYGSDAALYPVRASAPRLPMLRIPLLLTIAELEPQGFRDQGRALHQFVPAATFMELAGHNHFSTVFDIGSADVELSNAILALAHRSTP